MAQTLRTALTTLGFVVANVVAFSEVRADAVGPLANPPCDAFVKNADGTWTTNQKVTLTSGELVVTMRKGTKVEHGVPINGTDPLDAINQNCH